MIRILLGHRGKMLRGALAAVLSKEEDLQVVAEFGRTKDVLAALTQVQADVVVLEARMPAELVVAVRQLARGRPVLDVELAMTALHAEQNPLTEREREVLRMLATGATAQEIAHKLCLSAGTVRNYLSHILTKTDARSRIDAIRKAEEAGWI